MKQKQEALSDSQGQVAYSHYLASNCKPRLPEDEVTVEKMQVKKRHYLSEVQSILKLEEKISTKQSRSVQEVRVDLCPPRFT